MNHIMLDLETMGKGPDAAIVAIGACTFDDTRIGDRFYCKVSLDSAVRAGGVMDADTVMWWLRQSDAAREELQKDRMTIVDALYLFTHWVNSEANQESVCVWGNGAAFDNVILREAYNRQGLAAPWHYYNDRCYRTVKNSAPHIKINRTGGTHHNALDDAMAQAEHLIAIRSAHGQAADPVVESVRAKFSARAAAGLAKYGTDLTRTDYTRLQWLTHLQEELMDAACYAEVQIREAA